MAKKNTGGAPSERQQMAAALRVLAMDAVEVANSGHPGMPMGMADVATVLFQKHLRFDPTAPQWADRDRFVLSAGHGSMLLYGLLHLTGYADMPLSKIKAFRQLHSGTAGHPEYGESAGVETTTGPLGQGLGNAVGMAMAEQALAARFGGIINHHTYVIAGDGCLMEGLSQEAITLAGHQKLRKLIVLWDDNAITIDGTVSMSDSTDQLKRFAAAGWATMAVDGHDHDAIDGALEKAKSSKQPALIACKTTIGFGAPTKQGTAKAHGAPLGADEITGAKKALGWTAKKPFEIPRPIQKLWAATGARGASVRAEWEERFAKLSERKQQKFMAAMAGEAPAKLSAAVKRAKQQFSAEAPCVATRKASEMALNVLTPVMPEMIGGSADLTGSNNTKAAEMAIFSADNRAGRYVHYGVREHGMAAAMNGMALHGGLIPYGGTFLVFTDYCRPSIRLSALMKQRVIYVMTHDSIGLGEDGPTHQPVEHLAALRAIPNLAVYRPADLVETMECWELAVTDTNRPSVLALTRQNLPTFRTQHTLKNRCSQGAYIAREASKTPKVLLIATGSEVEIAMEAQQNLEAAGTPTCVVSAPCWERFAEQDEKYQRRVLPRGPVRVAIEAAVRDGWDRWLCGERGDNRKAAFVGMPGFGASGPHKDVYAHFGITVQRVVGAAQALL
jgi:transketolase